MYIRPIDTLLDPFRKYAQFRGRAPRAELWLFLLLGLIFFKLLDVGFYAAAERDQTWSYLDHHPRVWITTPHSSLDTTKQRERRYHWGLLHQHRHQDTRYQQDSFVTLANPDLSSCMAFYDNFSANTQFEYICVESNDGRYRAAAEFQPIMAYWLGGNITLTLLLFLPFTALVSRRLQDCGRSGWWTLLLAFPVTGLLVLIYGGFAGTAERIQQEKINKS